MHINDIQHAVLTFEQGMINAGRAYDGFTLNKLVNWAETHNVPVTDSIDKLCKNIAFECLKQNSTKPAEEALDNWGVRNYI